VLETFNYASPLLNDLLGELRPGAVFNVACIYEPFQKNNFSLDRFDLLVVLSGPGPQMSLKLVYKTDLYSRFPFHRCLLILLEEIVKYPGKPVSRLQLVTNKEKKQLLERFNDTKADYPADKTIHRLFEERKEKQPHCTAVVYKDQHLTYDALNRAANRLAGFLKSRGVGLGCLVGILVERSVDTVIGTMAILKAGGAYIPFEPYFPPLRIRTILADLEVGFMLTHYSNLTMMKELQWQLPHLTDVLVMDIHTPDLQEEPVNEEVVRQFWDHVSAAAVDDITAGGFISSYTGQPFTREEVDQYREHVKTLVQPHLGSEASVLEIGCGSGTIMFFLAGQVARYVGLDPSPATQESNRRFADSNEYRNIQLLTGFAHDIDSLETASFDIVILASTVQFFPGYLYLESRVRQALKLLKPGGIILLADLMDLRKKEQFRQSLETFRKKYKHRENIKTKTDLENELYVAEDFFHDLQHNMPEIARTEVLYRERGLCLELLFRYDVIIKKKGTGDAVSRVVAGGYQTRKTNQTWTVWHMLESSSENPSLPVSSSSFAYIIYTSGSTGTPKGVVEEHRPVINLIHWVNREFAVKSGDKLLFVTSLCFDLSVYDIFGILSGGGTIQVVPEDELREPVRLLEMIHETGITFWDSAPAALQQLVPYFEHTPSAGTMSIMRLVFLSGDWIPVGMPDKLKSYFDGVKVISLGGATEATVWSNVYPIESVDPTWVSIPYGKPIPNAKYYILDNHLEVCPPGVPGDLYIGGEVLAEGYVNDVELTAAKFIANPFCSAEIIYKTGDRARFMRDGNMEFLGRLDHQVKIRGFRIELGEIENQLLTHQAIEQAVVLARHDRNGQNYLCAYIVSATELSVHILRTHLSRILPAYMIPSYFVPLPELPLSSSGKIDRKALPDPETMKLDSGSRYSPPHSDIEQKLAGIWAEVLGREKVGIEDNYFALGGDSIKSLRIISRMHEIGYKLEVGNLFHWPTIRELAPAVKHIEPIREQSPITGNIPLTPIQRDFFEHCGVDTHHFNQAVLLHLEERWQEDAVRFIFTKIQEHHDALRMTFKRKNGTILQTNHGPDYPFSLQVWDLSDRPLYQARPIMLERANELQAGIDLVTGPLMKVGLFRLEDGDRLLIAVHHLVIDGVSWRIVFEDIEILYRHYKKHKEGKTVQLPLKSDSFKSWSEQLSRYADSDTFLAEKEYWKELAGTVCDPIPKDFPAGTGDAIEVERLSFSLSETRTRQLLTDAHRAFGTTNDDLLLCALGLALSDTFNVDKAAVAFEGHGREDILPGIRVDRTVGWFTSLCPLLLDLSFKHDLDRQVIEIKERLRQMPGKGIGYGILKYLTAEHNKPGISFEFEPQVLFNYLGQFDADLAKKPFKTAQESPGNFRSPRQQRRFELDVSAVVVNKQLTVTLSYSKQQYKSGTIRQLSQHYEENLNRIISFCCARKKRVATPGDFTYKKLSLDQVERLTEKYSIQDIYPLSPMQEGMLFHALYDDSPGAYFQQISYRLQGELDLELVKKSLNRLLERYDILRTLFIHQELKRPFQIVLNEQQVEFHYQDLRSLTPGKEKKQSVERIKGNDRQHSFVLDRDCLMRINVCQTAAREYEFIWSYHHILMDGWCLTILIAEFFEIYTAYRQNRPPQLTAVTPYRSYIQWLERQDKNLDKQYWYEYLKDYQEAAGVPKLSTRRKTRHNTLDRIVSFSIGKEKTDRLTALSAAQNITVSTFVHALWGVFLGKYNRKRDVVFGSVVAGRPSEIEGIETMVGLFINTIPVRVRYTTETTVAGLLRQVQNSMLEHVPHQYHPLAEIQTYSPLKQNLLDHIMVFENYPLAKEIGGLLKTNFDPAAASPVTLSGVEFIEQSNYDFNVTVMLDQQLNIKFQYNDNMFDSIVPKRMAAQFQQLLEQAIADESIPVHQLILLSDEEKQEILYQFNDTAVDYPVGKTVVHLFEEQVQKTPQKIAVLKCDKHMTFSALNLRANRLAKLLNQSGVRSNKLAAITGERSPELLVAILGILKAGGAYLPIDPAYPQERIDFMLKDSNAGNLVPWFDGLMVSRLGSPNGPGDQPTNLSTIQPSNLAYLIYTSGSTGKPKGVLVNHSGLTNLVNFHRLAFAYCVGTRMSQVSNIGFDAMVLEIWPALTSGAWLHIAPDDIRLDAGKMQSWLIKHKIEFSFQPTPIGELLLEQQWHETGTALKIMTVGGDELSTHLSRSFPFRLYNLYGPTEDTVLTTWTEVGIKSESSIKPVIGKPIDNKQVFILGSDQQPQPTGVAGELYIGGDGLARGYLNNPQLTAEKFIDLNKSYKSYKPYSKKGRLYRTGDLALWEPDGNIRFLGRIDRQVKIRGFRVELGEIENQLLQHEAVNQALVMVRQTGPRFMDKHLCAYIVFKPPLDSHTVLPNPEFLVSYLSGHLPHYMIPSYIIPLEKIPLTPGGKIDRGALPQPGDWQPGDVEKIDKPAGTIEVLLAGIWSEVLGIEKSTIGRTTDFFQAGGHSLKAAVVAHRIYRQWKVKLPMSELFRYSTLRELAQYIRNTGISLYTSLEQMEEQEYYPLSAAQERMYVMWQMQPESVIFNLPTIMSVNGNFEKHRLEKAINALIDRHGSLRTSFLPIGGRPVQRVHETIDLKVTYIDCIENKAEADRLVKEFIKPFDLRQGPLFRIGLIRLGKNKHILMVDMHHIVSDGLSMTLLVRDFFRLYKGETLAPLPFQYWDYCRWEERQFASGQMKHKENYWKDQFSDRIPVLDIPTDFQRPLMLGDAGSRNRMKLSTSLSEALKQLGAEMGLTLYMVMLAAYYILLSRYSCQEDIVVGVVVSGRDHPDLVDIVGVFINSLPMRNRPKGEKSLRQFFGEVKESALQGYENQDYPFDQLVKKLGLSKEGGRNPLIDVWFVSENIGSASGHIENLCFEPYAYENNIAHYELLMYCTDLGDAVEVILEYSTQLYKPATIKLMIERYCDILQQMVESPDKKLNEITISHQMLTARSTMQEDLQEEFAF
jgi:amino acid adenylation domain-containing protein/non-ribosomal peptide synthase protein (TIGR01720 family)